MRLASCLELENLMSQSAIASGDPYAFLVFANRPRASISPRMLTMNQLLVI